MIQTVGLASKLYLAVNSRVMLNRNIDTSQVLVNGVMGTIVSVPVSDELSSTFVQFDNKKNGVSYKNHHPQHGPHAI